MGVQSARAASPNLSQNIRHQLKPYVSEDMIKEQQQQKKPQSSTASSASNTLSSKHASSQNLDVNQQTTMTSSPHLTHSNHNLNNDTKDFSAKALSNININSQNSSNTNITASNATNTNDNKPSTSSNIQGTATTSTSTAADDDNDLESFFRDWRHFDCQTWHLEPTVRILYWAGKSIEPYGIDYILNKLGFSHARTTIPKWLQRGFMDPLDKVQALLMLQLLTIIRENKQEPAVKNNKNSN